jgi:hypothetical protein
LFQDKQSDGREFYARILQGVFSLVQSRTTGNFYATVKQCSIPFTFDEATAKAFIGERVTGSVVKKPCEPYEFASRRSGEIVQLDYRWVYVPEGSTIEEAIFEGRPEVAPADEKAKKSSILKI